MGMVDRARSAHRAELTCGAVALGPRPMTWGESGAAAFHASALRLCPLLHTSGEKFPSLLKVKVCEHSSTTGAVVAGGSMARSEAGAVVVGPVLVVELDVVVVTLDEEVELVEVVEVDADRAVVEVDDPARVDVVVDPAPDLAGLEEQDARIRDPVARRSREESVFGIICPFVLRCGLASAPPLPTSTAQPSLSGDVVHHDGCRCGSHVGP